ncbi:hypothetical protein LEMLEM_LOCUS1247 [Lemmus lemmus]
MDIFEEHYFDIYTDERTFHDNETHLLLAAPITSRGRWESKRFLSHLGKKLLMP